MWLGCVYLMVKRASCPLQFIRFNKHHPCESVCQVCLGNEQDVVGVGVFFLTYPDHLFRLSLELENCVGK